MGHIFLFDNYFLVFMSFSLSWMVFLPIICSTLVSFLKTMMGKVLKAFYNLDFSVRCASVLLEYFLDLVTLHHMNDVTDNGKHWLSLRFCWWSSCFLSSWSTVWICSVTISFLYPVSANCSISIRRVQGAWL